MPVEPPAAGARPCPYCGEEVPPAARACPHCDEDLGSIQSSDQAREIEAATRADAAARRFDAGTEAAFRRFRVRTMVWAGLLVLGVILFVAPGGSTDGGAVAAKVIGVLLIFFCGIGTLVTGIQDLLTKGPALVTTPELAVRTYLTAVKHGRRDYAYSLVVPRGRQGSRKVPLSEPLGLKGGTRPVGSAKDLLLYWKAVTATGGSMVRTTAWGKVEVEPTGDGAALAACAIKVTAYPSWITLTVLLSPIIAIILMLVIRKTVTLVAEFPVMEVDGRWYLVDPVPPLEFPEVP